MFAGAKSRQQTIPANAAIAAILRQIQPEIVVNFRHWYFHLVGGIMSKSFAIFAISTTLGLASAAASAPIAYQGFEGAGTWGFNLSTPREFAEDPAPLIPGNQFDATWREVTPDAGDTTAIDNSVTAGWTDGSFWGASNFGATASGITFREIEFDAIDVTPYTSVQLTFDYYFHQFDRIARTDNPFWQDNLTYAVNGASGTSVVPFGRSFRKDLNVSSGGWKTVTIDILDTTPEVELKIAINMRGADSVGLDNFQLTGILAQPTSVPLPAGGWMLLAGVAGFGVMRRRQKKG